MSKARYDLTSIGHVAAIFGFSTPECVETALAYQRAHPGVRLGDAMVRTGALTPDTHALLVAKHDQLRAKPRARDIATLLGYATEQTKTAVMRLAGIVGAADDCNDDD